MNKFYDINIFEKIIDNIHKYRIRLVIFLFHILNGCEIYLFTNIYIIYSFILYLSLKVFEINMKKIMEFNSQKNIVFIINKNMVKSF
jgi:hypothetical protein